MKRFINALLVSFIIPHLACAAVPLKVDGLKSNGDVAITGASQTTGSVAIGTSSAADSKAVLDVVSTTKGFLPPRMTTAQRDAIASPTAGLIVYNTTTNKLNQFNGTAWGEVAGSGSSGAQYNTLTNYNFEDTTYSTGWTASGGTLAAAAGTNILFGTQSATWDSSSAGQTLSYTAITIGQGYKGNNCEGAIYVQTPSGTATHLLEVYDGTNVLVSGTVITSTTARQTTVNFPCPSSGTMQLRLKSVAADEPLIAVDDAYLGLARNVGSTQLITEWASWTPTGSWTTNTTYTGQWRRVGDQYEFRIRLALGGAPTATGLTVNFLSSACSAVDTSKNNGTTAPKYIGYGSIRSAGSDSAAIVAYTSGTAATIIVPNTASTYIASSTAVSNTLPATFTSGDAVEITGSVPCAGWAASTVVMPDAQGWFAAASITGASASLSTTTQASFTEITNGSLTLTPSSGSAQIGIACASGTTNSAGATTCASANESLGVTVSVPTSGAYRVCASASNFLEDTGAATNVNATQTFKINRTSNANSTVVTSGDATAYTVLKTNSGGGGEVLGSAYPFSICSVFSLSSGSNTFRLMYSSSIAGTLATNTVDIAGGVSQSAYFRVEPVNSQQQAILANSVSTSATNGAYFNSAQVGSTGTVSKETGDWVSGSCSVASAVYTCTLVAGAFSTDPACHATIFGETTNYNAVVTSASTSSVVVRTFDTGNSAAAAAFALTCSSPR